MADNLVDFDIDTEFERLCDYTCMYLFLGGKERSMMRGAHVGFHCIRGPADSTEDHYGRNQETVGWSNPFDFASWMYDDTQLESHAIRSFVVERGVDAEFAIETMRASPNDVWSPYRSVSIGAGVLMR